MTVEEIVEAIRNQNSRHSDVLADFVLFCLDPNCKDLRFWQALINWSKWPYIILAKKLPVINRDSSDVIWRREEIADPFSWEEHQEP